jgi:hypothetical protein
MRYRGRGLRFSLEPRRSPWQVKHRAGPCGTRRLTGARPITSRFAGVRRRASVPASRPDTARRVRRSLPRAAIVAVTAAVSEPSREPSLGGGAASAVLAVGPSQGPYTSVHRCGGELNLCDFEER